MGTAIDLNDLGERQRIFVSEFCLSGDKIAAALAAGYAPSTAETASRRIMRTPEVLAAIHVEVGKQIVEDAVLARRVIAEIINDKDAPQKLKGDLAVKLLDRAGHVTPRAKAPEAGGKELHEMSLEELRAQRDQLDGAIAGRAKAVSAPVEPASALQASDLLE